MYNGKPETVHETVERVMREMGYLNNPQTLQTDIGNFTWYEDSEPSEPETTTQEEPYQITTPKQEQYYITTPPPNMQKYDNSAANYIDNLYNTAKDAYNDIKDEYFSTRNPYNRYKKGCTPSNIAYNTITNYQISSNPKLVEKGNFVSNKVASKTLSKIPFVGNYVNNTALGGKIGNGVANLYNALEEADCFK